MALIQTKWDHIVWAAQLNVAFKRSWITHQRGAVMPNGADDLTWRNGIRRSVWGLGAFVGAGILALVFNYVTDGSIVRALGGISHSQLAAYRNEHVALTNCGNTVPTFLGEADKTICFLSNVSIREGNAIAPKNTDGWTVCRIEENQDKKLYLTAQMNGVCRPIEGGVPEIACKARCINFSERSP